MLTFLIVLTTWLACCVLTLVLMMVMQRREQHAKDEDEEAGAGEVLPKRFLPRGLLFSKISLYLSMCCPPKEHPHLGGRICYSIFVVVYHLILMSSQCVIAEQRDVV